MIKHFLFSRPPGLVRIGSSALFLSALSVLLTPSSAFAHHVMNTDQSPFMGGLSLPIHGADHMLAMVAIGIWAVLAGNRGRWAIPTSFLAFMLMGMALGVARIGFPMVEQGVVLSICAFGILIALATRLPFWATASVAGFFALFHGYACGADLPNKWSPIPYGLGLILCTAILVAGGFVTGGLVKKLSGNLGLRIAGGCLTVAGIYLAFGSQ